MRLGQLTERQRAMLLRVAGGGDLTDAPPGDKRSASTLGHRGLLLVRRLPWRATLQEPRLILERLDQHMKEKDKTEQIDTSAPRMIGK